MADLYDVAIVTARIGATPKALGILDETLKGPNARGKLLGCWYSDIGALNQILFIRGFGGEGELARERATLAKSDNPFGVADLSTAMTMDTYMPFDFVAPVPQGKLGPVYEVRTYLARPGGLAGTIESWRKALPARLKMSPLAACMHTIGGAMPRFMHIWPYPDLAARHKIRADSVKAGIWPPPGGAERLLIQQSDIYFPAAFSPLQ